MNRCQDQQSDVDLLKVKFTPDSDLAKELLSTGDKHLVESGRNKEYACGLSLVNKDIFDKKKHSGKNRLGTLLMERRDVLNRCCHNFSFDLMMGII